MKKISLKLKKHFISRQKRKYRKELHEANLRQHQQRINEINRKINREYYETTDIRDARQSAIYKKIKYKGKPITIDISGDFGIEIKKDIPYFLDTVASFIDTNSSKRIFNLANCNRVWPSAITLFCSLEQWVELTSKRTNKPLLSSTEPNSPEVDSYLSQCGFYDYVGRATSSNKAVCKDSEVVKIERETKRKNIERREDQILELLKLYSGYSSEELELFDSVILTEIFNNVTEHGKSHYDSGWWLLAQHHARHNIISFCVADNGIGIRNNLMSGPQRVEIAKKLDDEPLQDGEFIKLALQENVSGSLSASVKSGRMIKRYETGARRGNGLKRIEKATRQLGIKLSILSHHGYLFLDEHGSIIDCGSRKNRIFAGTMYHLVINTNRSINNEAD